MSATYHDDTRQPLARAHLAAGFLVRAQRRDGAFRDLYDLKGARFDDTSFNDVRHAAATLALYRVTQLPGGDQWLSAADAAVRYIRRSCQPVIGNGKGYASGGKVRLGGQALAILALLERKSVTGDDEDDGLIEALAVALQRMEQPSQAGSFFQSFELGRIRFLSTPSSEAYPGQAVLALYRLNDVFPDAARAALLERALHFQLSIRDGDITRLERPARPDLWLTQSLTEMFRGTENRAARAMINLQAVLASAGIRRAVARGSESPPAGDARPISDIAVRVEILGSISHWAVEHGDFVLSAECNRSIDQAMSRLRGQQLWDDGATLQEAVGAWPFEPGGRHVRLDTVTHGIGAFIVSIESAEIQATTVVDPPEKAPVRDKLRTGVQSVHDAAVRRGIPVREVSIPSQRVELGTGAYQRRFWGLSVSGDSAHGVKIAQDKFQAKQRMAAAGLPTPIGYPVSTVEKALSRARSIGYPVVLKPRAGNKGQDVYIELKTEEELARAWPLLSRTSPRNGALLEKFMPGEEYRVLVVGGKAVAVNHRIPPTVVGDGRSTIGQLISIENARPERAAPGSGSALCLIVVDDQTHELLEKVGRNLDSVLPNGERQLVRRTSNASGGGSTAEVTARIHPDNAFICETAARICELGIAGVDFIAPDIGVSVVETGGGVIEVNSSPGLHDHFLPGSGEPIDAGAMIVDSLYPPGAPFRASLILVLGDDPRVAMALRDRFEADGKVTGLLTAEAFEVRGIRLKSPASGRALDIGPLMSNPLVEVAIVQIAPTRTALDDASMLYLDVVVATGVNGGSSLHRDLISALGEPDRGWVVVGNAGDFHPEGNVITLRPDATSDEIARTVADFLEA